VKNRKKVLKNPKYNDIELIIISTNVENDYLFKNGEISFDRLQEEAKIMPLPENVFFDVIKEIAGGNYNITRRNKYNKNKKKRSIRRK
jgi:hypothetical protein